MVTICSNNISEGIKVKKQSSRYIQNKQNIIIFTYAVSKIAKELDLTFSVVYWLLKQFQEIEIHMIVDNCKKNVDK